MIGSSSRAWVALSRCGGRWGLATLPPGRVDLCGPVRLESPSLCAYITVLAVAAFSADVINLLAEAACIMAESKSQIIFALCEGAVIIEIVEIVACVLDTVAYGGESVASCRFFLCSHCRKSSSSHHFGAKCCAGQLDPRRQHQCCSGE